MDALRDEEADQDDGEQIEQFLTFQLKGELFGIGILNIREIVEYGNVTRVPLMPEFIGGVINLRGSVVPVINLAKRFQFESSKISKKTSVIVIELPDEDGVMEVGIIVDMVNEVLELGQDQLSTAPSFGTKIRADFIKYMGQRQDGSIIILLEVKNVLSIGELSTLKQIRENAS